MFTRRSRTRIRQATRTILAFLGACLMIASFVWMQRTPRLEPTTRLTTSRPTPAPRPFAVVILDPGHGGQDSGAICGGVLEKDLALDEARRIDRLLQAEGIATLMTRLGDTYRQGVSLALRFLLPAAGDRFAVLHPGPGLFQVRHHISHRSLVRRGQDRE